VTLLHDYPPRPQPETSGIRLYERRLRLGPPGVEASQHVVISAWLSPDERRREHLSPERLAWVEQQLAQGRWLAWCQVTVHATIDRWLGVSQSYGAKGGSSVLEIAATIDDWRELELRAFHSLRVNVARASNSVGPDRSAAHHMHDVLTHYRADIEALIANPEESAMVLIARA
jgi:hypothetical protein